VRIRGHSLLAKEKGFSQEPAGVGAEFDYRSGPGEYLIIVKHVYTQALPENSLKMGDRITQIEGKQVECKTPASACEWVNKLYGPAGSKVSVVVMRRNGGSHRATPLTLVRAASTRTAETETEPTPAA